MINKKIVLPAAMIACAAISGVTQANSGWYVGASLNAVDVDNVNTQSAPVAGVARRLSLDTDSDTGLGLKLGKTVWENSAGHKLNVEVSYSSSEHDIENIQFMNNNFNAAAGRASGSVEVDALFLSAVYQFKLGAINPYVGLGIGQVDFSVDARYGMSVNAASGTPPFANNGDDATAIQYRIGAEYALNKKTGLFVEYSATSVDDIEFSRRGGGPGGLATTTQSGDFDYDTFSLGVKYHF